MSQRIRQRLAPVHSWLGLLLSWLMYFIVLTGTAGYFDAELDHWMRPEAPTYHTAESAPPAGGGPKDSATAAWLNMATMQLEQHAGAATYWSIDFPLARYPFLSISWEHPEQGMKTAWLDPNSGEVLPVRDTAGSQTLYRMHWRLHYLPETLAYWLVGICAAVMCLATLSGVIIHRRIFADFFTFRPGKKLRSWLDVHNLLSVTTLPFQLMISYSALAFFAFTYLPTLIPAFYGSDAAASERLYHDVFNEMPHTHPSGQSAQPTPLDRPLAHAQAHWGANQIRYISIDNRGDAQARITIAPVEGRDIKADSPLIYNGMTGAWIPPANTSSRTGLNAYHWLTGLHEGLFASLPLRWLYALSGLILAGIIATGCILWEQKRQRNLPPTRGLRLVKGMNAGTLMGLPAAIACYFLANRLLPTHLAGRAELEVNCLFAAWAALTLHGFVRPAQRVWQEQCFIAATLYGLLPLINALTTDRGLVSSVAAGDWTFVGTDLFFLAVAMGAAFTGKHLRTSAAGQRRAKLFGQRKHTAATPQGNNSWR
ncbi:PepSY domain-containing protein [Spongiibacter taiwanensis]|uniref:PepSY-associated TM helix domain-containing protein n=1 Tax=Spongiibacter taiwanensis TaxID=1748242 RepID=UPI002035E781|nr:PepSY-associated TM helix domain-containing protein [Spongiibacter taiwanensis]USA42674.1 PepSY domain-containing protein [Spongiibacter taiwanensis]